jgi:hypothetical protein
MNPGCAHGVDKLPVRAGVTCLHGGPALLVHQRADERGVRGIAIYLIND